MISKYQLVLFSDFSMNLEDESSRVRVVAIVVYILDLQGSFGAYNYVRGLAQATPTGKNAVRALPEAG